MLLEVKHLTKTYQRGSQPVHALRGVSLKLTDGHFYSVMGPSGSGKSTLLHILGGLDRPTAGEVVFDGKQVGSFSDNELALFRRRSLGFIFQFFNLLPMLSAVENVALPLLLDGQKMSDIKPQALALLKQMNLVDRADHKPDQLSGGEMQRVAIARAMITKPLLVLADEPTGNLDTKTGQMVLELLSKMSKENGVAVLMVTHDPKAASYGDRVIRMRDGSIESEEAVKTVEAHA